MRRRSRALFAALLAFGLLGACGGTVEVGLDEALTGGGGGAGGGVSSGGTAGSFELGGVSPMSGGDGSSAAGAAACTPIKCRGMYYACGDCLDNDGDGLIDAADPDCLGPCDNDEAGLSNGLPVATSAACREYCYFDGGAGPGNDKCEWSLACDPLSVAPDYPPSGDTRCAYDAKKDPMGIDCAALQTTQDPTCLAACLPLVPNGCDCFGCCQLPDGNFHYVGRGRGDQGCQLDDQAACPPCTPVKSCFNDCGKCETCVGGVRPDPSCGSGSCKAGQKSCGPDEPCDAGDYCVTGCCITAPKPT